MRLWHYQLLPYLPKSQLLSQKREIDLIWKNLEQGKETHHILIDYIWDCSFPELKLAYYYYLLKLEFDKRGYKFKNNSILKNVNSDTFKDMYGYKVTPYGEHNLDYLLQCYYNLEEKYQRGQKDFTKEEFNRLHYAISKIKRS